MTEKTVTSKEVQQPEAKKSNTLFYCCAAVACCLLLVLAFIVIIWCLSFFGVVNFSGLWGSMFGL